MTERSFEYLGKSDVEKIFNRLKAKNSLSVETDYSRCCETTEELRKSIVSIAGERVTVLDGNLKDYTDKYTSEYSAYAKQINERKRDRWFPNDVSDPVPMEQFVESCFKTSHRGLRIRFEKYSPSKKEENRVIFLDLKKPNRSRSKSSFYFCIYYDSDSMLCMDKLHFVEKNYNDVLAEIETAKTSPETINEFFRDLSTANDAGKVVSIKNQIKRKDDNTKKAKVNTLKLKAGEINIRKILNDIDCNYTLEKQNASVLIILTLKSGKTTVKIPNRNLSKSLEKLKGFVEAIVDGDKLNIHFRHRQK